MERISKRPVTLKAIAETVGCSVATVSTVLNGSKGNTAVGNEMRRRILAAAEEMGYRPNFASRLLKKRRSNTLGVYVQPNPWRGIGYSYETSILRGIEDGARERGYDLLLLNMGAQVLPRICSDYLAESRIDGILLLHTDSGADWVDELVESGSPVVAVDCCGEKTTMNRIAFDNAAAVVLAVKTLVEQGHRRIGFAGCCTSTKMAEEELREITFRQVRQQFGLSCDDELVFNEARCVPPISSRSAYCQMEGVAALRYFISLPNPPSAIIAYNSLVAVSILYEAQKFDVRIPDDFSLIGFDDRECLYLIHPQISVIDHPLPQMGMAGADLLIDLIDGKVKGPVVRTFPPELIRRESVIRFPAGRV